MSNEDIERRLQGLHDIFTKASRGDFSQNVDIPAQGQAFRELYAGVQIMIDVTREKIKALEGANTALQQQVDEKDKLLNRLQREKINLAEAVSKSDAIFASIGEGIIVIDKKGHMVIINEVAKEMLGIQGAEILGQSILRAIPLRREDMRVIPFKQRPLYRALSTGQTIKSEATYYYTRTDGSSFPVVFTATPVKLHNHVVGAILVFRDVSHEKEVDRAKTEFVSLASHQLRTPLTMINWYVERLLRGRTGQISDQQRLHLEEVERGGARMAALVQSLLNVSQIELGTFALEPQVTDIHEVAQNVLNELRPAIKIRQLKIYEHYSEALPRIVTDPKVLHIVLQNIMSNAVKYTPAGGTVSLKVVLESRKKTLSKADANILICVADTGLGIPRKQQKKVFNKLFRADNVKELDTDGSGLGLYIARSMVHYCGGEIWFDSVEGKGTTFYVLLPLTKSTVDLKKAVASVV